MRFVQLSTMADLISISIIGTAGRGADLAKLNRASFPLMLEEAGRVAAKLANGQPWAAVSGGSSWADHLAVVLFLDGSATSLRLHLPASFSWSGFVDNGQHGSASWKTNPAATLNRHHANFAQKSGRDPFEDLARAIARPECTVRITPGLLERNSVVAEDCGHCVAFTFGRGAQVKKGGTHDTMEKFLRRPAHGTSVHVDLNVMRAFSPARL